MNIFTTTFISNTFLVGVFVILGIIYLVKKDNPSQNTQTSIDLSSQNESTKNLMGLIAKGIGIKRN